MQKLNKFLDSELYYGFSYGIGIGAVLFSGAYLVIFIGVVLILITYFTRAVRRTEAKK